MAAPKPFKVLYYIHPGFDNLDFTGPLEIFSMAKYPSSSTPAFTATITAIEPTVTSGQNCTFTRHIPLTEAYSNLADFDVLLIPGGNVGDPGGLLEQKCSEPLELIRAFVALPKKSDGSVRTLLSVCTGGLLLGEAGVLDGKSATTYFKYYDRLAELCAAKGKTQVLKERYVANKVDDRNGLRIVTAGGVSCGLDASLWLVKELVGLESAELSAQNTEYAWRQGIVL